MLTLYSVKNWSTKYPERDFLLSVYRLWHDQEVRHFWRCQKIYVCVCICTLPSLWCLICQSWSRWWPPWSCCGLVGRCWATGAAGEQRSRGVSEPLHIPSCCGAGWYEGINDLRLVAEVQKLGNGLLGWCQRGDPSCTDALAQGSMRGCRLRAALLAKHVLNDCLERLRAWLPFWLKWVRLLWHQFICHVNENTGLWSPWSSGLRPKSASSAWLFTLWWKCSLQLLL